MAAAVKADIVERQFLVTGALTRELYDEACLFKDEIDTYTLDKWVVGTAKLFDEAQSHVDLVGQASGQCPRASLPTPVRPHATCCSEAREACARRSTPTRRR